MAAGGTLAGRVSIGSSTTVGKLFYAPMVSCFGAEYPGVILDLFEGGFYQLLEGLDTRRQDFAVMVDVEPRSSFVLEPLVTDQLYVFGLPDDERLEGEEIGIADLEALPIVAVRPPSGPRMTLERAAARANVALDIVHDVGSPDVIKSFVSQRLGYGVLPRCALRADVQRGRFKALAIDDLYLTRMLVRRADQPESPAADVVAQAIRDEFARLCSAGAFSALAA